MEFPLNSDQNQMDDEKTTIQLRKKYWEENFQTGRKAHPVGEVEIDEKRRNSNSSEEEKIPEIKDIYDHIYGNVQSKLQFYENKQDKVYYERTNSFGHKDIVENSKDNTRQEEVIKADKTTSSDSNDVSGAHDDTLEKLPTNVKVESFKADFLPSSTSTNTSISGNDSKTPEEVSIKPRVEKILKIDIPLVTPTSQINDVQKTQNGFKFNEGLDVDDSPATPTPVNSPTFEKKFLEKQLSMDSSKSSENKCSKCQKTDFINDRSEVLTEINANLKLELESVKHDLKKEMAKNNELNFEIANIEAALETYYKEAKNQKSTLSSIYSAMRNYVSDQKTDFQESYTYKRIKMIADYMESLKGKLEHQDRIIKNNFIENPYYTDLIIRHEAVLKQLDKMSSANQELEDAMKRKAAEELDTIKELNRQKFQAENKCKEMENYYRNEVITKEALIRSVEDEYRKQLEDFQAVLDQKDEELAKVQKTATARINNYKQELVIVYRKWKEQKLLNSNK